MKTIKRFNSIRDFWVYVQNSSRKLGGDLRTLLEPGTDRMEIDFYRDTDSSGTTYHVTAVFFDQPDVVPEADGVCQQVGWFSSWFPMNFILIPIQFRGRDLEA